MACTAATTNSFPFLRTRGWAAWAVGAALRCPTRPNQQPGSGPTTPRGGLWYLLGRPPADRRPLFSSRRRRPRCILGEAVPQGRRWQQDPGVDILLVRGGVGEGTNECSRDRWGDGAAEAAAGCAHGARADTCAGVAERPGHARRDDGFRPHGLGPRRLPGMGGARARVGRVLGFLQTRVEWRTLHRAAESNASRSTRPCPHTHADLQHPTTPPHRHAASSLPNPPLTSPTTTTPPSRCRTTTPSTSRVE